MTLQKLKYNTVRPNSINVAMIEDRVFRLWPVIISNDLRRDEIDHCNVKLYECSHERGEVILSVALNHP